MRSISVAGRTKDIGIILTFKSTRGMFVPAGLDSVINDFGTLVNERSLHTIAAKSRFPRGLAC